MWKEPSRPNHKVTQSFNDGLVTIYNTKDIAKPGYTPVIQLATKKASLRYEEKRLGINRYNSALQNQVEIERVIRSPRMDGITTQDVAITEDGRQYTITMIQTTENIYPPSMDISLTRIDQMMEVPNEVV